MNNDVGDPRGGVGVAAAAVVESFRVGSVGDGGPSDANGAWFGRSIVVARERLVAAAQAIQATQVAAAAAAATHAASASPTRLASARSSDLVLYGGDNDGDGDDLGSKAGSSVLAKPVVVIGLMLLVAAIAICICCYCWRRRRRQAQQRTGVEMTSIVGRGSESSGGTDVVGVSGSVSGSGSGYERVVTVELRPAAFDAHWFESTWTALNAPRYPPATTSALQLRAESTSLPDGSTFSPSAPVDCAMVEQFLHHHRFTVLASGARGGAMRIYFFAQDSASFKCCLGELVITPRPPGSSSSSATGHSHTHAHAHHVPTTPTGEHEVPVGAMMESTLKCDDPVMLRAFAVKLHAAIEPLLVPTLNIPPDSEDITPEHSRISSRSITATGAAPLDPEAL